MFYAKGKAGGSARGPAQLLVISTVKPLRPLHNNSRWPPIFKDGREPAGVVLPDDGENRSPDFQRHSPRFVQVHPCTWLLIGPIPFPA